MTLICVPSHGHSYLAAESITSFPLHMPCGLPDLNGLIYKDGW